jgi:phosphoglucomutase
VLDEMRRALGHAPAAAARTEAAAFARYKVYAESFRGEEHLRAIQAEAREIVAATLRAAG